MIILIGSFTNKKKELSKLDIPIETVSNNKQRKYNHYTQQQRDKIEEALREHGNSWSGDIIAKYMNVPLFIVYTWKRELFENGIFQVLC